MRVQTSKGDLKVVFNHVQPIVTKRKLDQRNPPGEFVNKEDAGTYCSIIHMIEEEGNPKGIQTIVAQGRSIISPADVYKFNKDKGRKRALTRALYNLFPSRSQKVDRKLVWNAYFSR